MVTPGQQYVTATVLLFAAAACAAIAGYDLLAAYWLGSAVTATLLGVVGWSTRR